ncbi:MAG TPA: SRPBCC domain-containing protein [Natrialbaceae archaeon]|nr:SRPBCC domain-containing protein [Natrialbaceae archaeon]
MKEIRIETEIDAPPEAVWETLTDFAAYEEWNPFFTSADGDLRVGGPVDVGIDAARRPHLAMTMTITEVIRPRRLQWVGTFGGRWVFRGQHTFDLQALDGDRTLFVNREAFSGVLVPILTRGLRHEYETMNRALADRVEGGSVVETAP